MTTSIDALRQKLQQLQTLHDNGTLSAKAYAQARSQVERELVAQVMAEAAPATPAAARPSRRLQALLMLGVVAIAVAGYAVTGSPGLVGLSPSAAPVADAGADHTQPGELEMAAVVDKLAQRLKEKPDDVKGWTLLARAYSAMGRHAEAVPVYQKVLALTGETANLLADYADTLGALNGGRLSDEAIKLVERALVLEPENIKARALAGSAAFDRRDYATAVRQWESVVAALPPDSSFVPELQASIAQARELGGMPPAAPRAAAAPMAATTATAPPATAQGMTTAAPTATTAISGSVGLAPALAKQVSPEDTVFIFARPAEGPRMPLAVLRKQVKDLPTNFTLDDSLAMAPTAKISDHARIIVSARISKSGNAVPQPGDLLGQAAAAVAPGARGVQVTISETVPK
jgi:cytochrome c-type biogenesis protein CcmH